MVMMGLSSAVGRVPMGGSTSVGDYNTINLAFFYLFFAQKYRLFAQKSRPGSFPPETAAGTVPETPLFSFYGEKVMKSG